MFFSISIEFCVEWDITKWYSVKIDFNQPVNCQPGLCSDPVIMFFGIRIKFCVECDITKWYSAKIDFNRPVNRQPDFCTGRFRWRSTSTDKGLSDGRYIDSIRSCGEELSTRQETTLKNSTFSTFTRYTCPNDPRSTPIDVFFNAHSYYGNKNTPCNSVS